MAKKRPKRRKQHRLRYYVAKLPAAETSDKILSLLDDAAHQPKRVISDKDYEKIYWRAHDLLKGEC